jgi:hypothetical protein
VSPSCFIQLTTGLFFRYDCGVVIMLLASATDKGLCSNLTIQTAYPDQDWSFLLPELNTFNASCITSHPAVSSAFYIASP